MSEVVAVILIFALNIMNESLNFKIKKIKLDTCYRIRQKLKTNFD